MRYILLDFDGVLTSEAFTRQCKFEWRRENIYGLDWFDPSCVKALKAIVDATGAGIVVSSSWRDLGKEKLSRVWEFVPLPGDLVGTTPVWTLTKKRAIEHWIRKHPEDDYVILDDTDLGLPNQVRTKMSTGLTLEDAFKAIEVLRKTSSTI